MTSGTHKPEEERNADKRDHIVSEKEKGGEKKKGKKGRAANAPPAAQFVKPSEPSPLSRAARSWAGPSRLSDFGSIT